jgi:ferredoxin
MLKLSGEKLTKKDKLVLEGYKKYQGDLSCRFGCNECEAACPHHLPINKIMRYNYYFSVKKQEKRAISKFAKLNSKKPSDVCSHCAGHCEKACRFGVSTRTLLAMAQRNMDLVV